MQIYYISAEGERIDFDGKTYGISEMDVFGHEMSYKTKEEKIIEFEKKIKENELEINISDGKEGTWQEYYDYINEIFERDSLNNKKGKLYVNGRYLACNIYACEVEDQFRNWCDFQVCKLRIVTDEPVWITEKTFQFARYKGDGTRKFLNFPFNFPYNFTGVKKGVGVLANDNYAPAHFTMSIYGNNYANIENPSVEIGGYTYTVHTTVNDMETLRIDSKNRTVKKILANGTEVNEFNSRNFHNSVFEKIKPGTQKVKWSGEYDIILTIYQERSEPKWNQE